MEYLGLGDLQQCVLKLPSLTEHDASIIAAQSLEGLHFMHDNGFAHRDMKPKVGIVLAVLYHSLALLIYGTERPRRLACTPSVVDQDSGLRHQ
jgi:calcium/calmodulin-dependent protein kinase I